MSAESWDLRGRAESFGAGAEEYDAVRARYPDAAVRAVVAGHPPAPAAAGGAVRVLDVGTGTGILARALVAAGAGVTGSDVDAGMAAVARRSGLTVHVGPFERLDLDDRFDRITVGQAWHWIDPEAGLAAVRRLLAPGGQLWLLWNVGEPEPVVKAATDAVYARFAGELAGLADGGISRGVSGRAADRAEESFGAVPSARVHAFAVAVAGGAADRALGPAGRDLQRPRHAAGRGARAPARGAGRGGRRRRWCGGDRLHHARRRRGRSDRLRPWI